MLDEAEELQGQLPEAERAHMEVEHQALWLPSALPPSHRKHNCNQRLIEIETQLRRAECNDTLDKIRSLQRGCLSFISFRNRHVRGQNPSTRAQDTIDRLEDKSKALALKYRDARAALYALLGPGEWERELRELNHGDLTTPDGHEISIEDPNDPIGPDGRLLSMSKKKKKILKLGLGEGRRAVSWIWTSTAAIGDGSDKVLHEGIFFWYLGCLPTNFFLAVRIEWVKARARHLRWWEEVHLLREEMRRVRKTLEWRAAWWKERSEGWDGLDEATEEGVKAYASRQASIQCSLHKQFSRLWDKPLTPLVSSDDTGEAPSTYVDPVLKSLVEEDVE
jgi:hypothetical protein